MESQMNGVAAEEAAAARVYEELPDASRANRRPPHHSPPRTISTKGHTGCLAVHSDLLVLGHHDKLRTYRAKDSWEPRWHNLSIGHERREIKLSTLAFRPTASDNVRGSSTANGVTRSDGRHLWCGTKEGDLLEFDIEESRFTSHRTNAHTAPVILLELVGRNMISVDESGKVSYGHDRWTISTLIRLAPIDMYMDIQKRRRKRACNGHFERAAYYTAYRDGQIFMRNNGRRRALGFIRR